MQFSLCATTNGALTSCIDNISLVSHLSHATVLTWGQFDKTDYCLLHHKDISFRSLDRTSCPIFDVLIKKKKTQGVSCVNGRWVGGAGVKSRMAHYWTTIIWESFTTLRNLLLLHWAPWFPPRLCSLRFAINHSLRISESWLKHADKGLSNVYLRWGQLHTFTKELHMMTTQKCPKASAVPHYQIQITMPCIQFPFIQLRWSWSKRIIKVPTVQKEAKPAPAEGLKGIPPPGWDLFSFYFPPSLSRLFPPLLLPSPPFFSPQQDAAWTSARYHGNQDWGGFSRDRTSLGADWSDAQKYGREGWGGDDVTLTTVWEGSSLRSPASIHRQQWASFFILGGVGLDWSY